MGELLTVWVPGIPKPKGSKKAFIRGKRAVVVENNNDKLRPWMSSVTLAARDAGAKPLDGPVSLSMVFLMPRPQAHFMGNDRARPLRVNAPFNHTSTPDATKLGRAVEDALIGVAFRDDSQVSALSVWKVYEDSDGSGVMIRVEPMVTGPPAYAAFATGKRLGAAGLSQALSYVQDAASTQAPLHPYERLHTCSDICAANDHKDAVPDFYGEAMGGPDA